MRCLIYVEKALQIPALDKIIRGGGKILCISELRLLWLARRLAVISSNHYILIKQW